MASPDDRRIYEFRGALLPEQFEATKQALSDLALSDFFVQELVVDQTFDDLLTAEQIEEQFNTASLDPVSIDGRPTYSSDSEFF